jgi:hypothetical protein
MNLARPKLRDALARLTALGALTKHAAAPDLLRRLRGYNPNQERDERGRWTSTGGKAAEKAFEKRTKGAFGLAGTQQDFTQNERSALNAYKDGQYTSMNKALAQDKPGALSDHAPAGSSLRKTINAAIKGVERGIASKGGLVYRGLSSKNVAAKDWESQVGKTITWPAFTSTSRSWSFAKGWGERTLFRVYVPKDATALEYKLSHSGTDGEQEVILPPASRFYVKAVRQTNKDAADKHREIDLVLIKPKKKASK